MTAWLAGLVDALAFHLMAHRRLAMAAGLTGVGGSVAVSLMGGGTRTGVPKPGAPVMAAVVVLGFGIMAGAVGGEVRSGRAALWMGISGSPGRWLRSELALRTLALGVVVLTVVLAAALALLPLDPAASRGLLRGAPTLAALALLVAAVGFGCSGLTERLDTLLASLYVFPWTFALVGVTAGWPAVPRGRALALAFPLDPLLSLAPAGAVASAPPVEPAAVVHLVVFWGVWAALGLTGGWLRVRRRPGRAD